MGVDVVFALFVLARVKVEFGASFRLGGTPPLKYITSLHVFFFFSTQKMH